MNFLALRQKDETSLYIKGETEIHRGSGEILRPLGIIVSQEISRLTIIETIGLHINLTAYFFPTRIF